MERRRLGREKLISRFYKYVKETLFGRGSNNMGKNRIVINGNVIEYDGNGSLNISGGTISVNGKTIASDLSGIVEVRLEGDVRDVRCDSTLSINGNVNGDAEAGNSANISGNVGGNVKAGNSVHCGDVKGNIKAGNSVYRR